MKVAGYVPQEKMGQFHAILCATGGRYLRNPLLLYGGVEVHYEPGDYVAQLEAWTRCVTPIREVRRDQWWRRMLRRCGLWFLARMK